MAIVALAWLLLGVPSALAQRDYHGRTMAEWENDLVESVTEVRRQGPSRTGSLRRRGRPRPGRGAPGSGAKRPLGCNPGAGQIGPEARDALPALVRATEDEDESVREASAKALERVRGN